MNLATNTPAPNTPATNTPATDPAIASGPAEAASRSRGNDTALTLTGVGVGPGDPELLTLKAVRILREADVVFAPTTALDKPSRAEQIVRQATGVEARRIVFALDDTGGLTAARTAAWDEAARTVLEAFSAGARRIAFATLGDPNVYSTFAYLARTITERSDVAKGSEAGDPTITVQTVSGITAMQDLAARVAMPLAEGSEPLTLLPAVGPDESRVLEAVRNALAGPGTVVLYKAGRHLDDLITAVDEAGRTSGAILGSNLGLPTEHVSPLAAYTRHATHSADFAGAAHTGQATRTASAVGAAHAGPATHSAGAADAAHAGQAAASAASAAQITHSTDPPGAGPAANSNHAAHSADALGAGLAANSNHAAHSADAAGAGRVTGATAPYFTTLIAPPKRGQRGGAL